LDFPQQSKEAVNGNPTQPENNQLVGYENGGVVSVSPQQGWQANLPITTQQGYGNSGVVSANQQNWQVTTQTTGPKRCIHVSGNGKQCPRNATFNSDYCKKHYDSWIERQRKEGVRTQQQVMAQKRGLVKARMEDWKNLAKSNAEQQIQNIRKQLDDRLLKLDYISQKLEFDCQAYPLESINNSTIDPQVNYWLSQ